MKSPFASDIIPLAIPEDDDDRDYSFTVGLAVMAGLVGLICICTFCMYKWRSNEIQRTVGVCSQA